MEPAAAAVKSWDYQPHPLGFAISFRKKVKFYVTLESEAREYVLALNTNQDVLKGSIGDLLLGTGSQSGSHLTAETRFDESLQRREMRRKEKGL